MASDYQGISVYIQGLYLEVSTPLAIGLTLLVFAPVCKQMLTTAVIWEFEKPDPRQIFIQAIPAPEQPPDPSDIEAAA
jgi:hypothetical protein